MSGMERLVDVGDGSPVSNGCSSPLSPDCSTILDTPLSLDFDPMSFQFQEVVNPSASTNGDDDRNSEPIIIKSANYTNSDLDVYDPLVTSDLDLVPKPSLSSQHESNIRVPLAYVETGPDILDTPSICNPNPDLVLIDNFGSNGDDPQQISDKSESPPSEDYTSSSSEMIDTLDSTNDDSHVVDCIDAITVTSASSSCVENVISEFTTTSITTSTTSSQQLVDVPGVALLELNDTHETNVLSETHDDEEDNGSLSSDSDSDARSKQEIKKRAILANIASKKVVSTESNVTEHDSSRKEIVTKKSTQVQEQTIQVSSKKGEVTKSISKESNIIETNSKQIDMNGQNHDSDSSSDELENSKVEFPISVSKLDDSLIFENSLIDQDDIHYPQKEVIMAVDLKSLVKNTKAVPNKPPMPLTERNKQTPPTVPNKQAVIIAATRKMSNTKSVQKTSFSKATDETENYISSPVEEVKPSVDRAQVARKFSQEANALNASEDEHEARGHEDDKCLCKICDKHVYQMEKIKAEKSVFHKNCFKCKECHKTLTVDNYSSHEGELFCKPHFKMLFQPKARFEGEDLAPNEKSDTEQTESEEGKQRRNEMVIRENVPDELPPDVIRCDTKSNDLESLPNLNLSNIKSRFESPQEELKLPSTSDLCTLQRSPSIMARLAKYQSAVSKESHTNGDLSSGEDEIDHDVTAPVENLQKEKVYFSGMSSLKTQWESGKVSRKDGDEEDVKDELAKLRQRICLGRSESMKAVYEKACQDSKSPVRSESVVLGRDVKALSIKDKFEKGSVENDEEIETEKFERLRKEKEEDLSVLVEPGTATGARSLFKQMDASVKSPSPPMLSPSRSPSSIIRKKNDSVSEGDVIKSGAPMADDVQVDTTLITQKFKFFENFKDEQKERKRFQITPPREPAKENSPEVDIVRDPNIVRSSDIVEDLPTTDTAKRMLDKFKALETQASQDLASTPTTPKPLKRITPPRDEVPKNNQQEKFAVVEQQPDPDIVRCSYKSDEDVVVEVDKAKSLRAKFENWETEVSRENLKNEKMAGGNCGNGNAGNGVEEDDYLPQVDTTKNLKAKFEAIKDDTNNQSEKPKPKVSRFIQEQQNAFTESCNICEKRLYQLEKMEASGMKFHKNCFRCAHCNCVLRLENFTTSGGKLFCTPHFKQLFKSKGNYDEGFGREQHKEKWNRSRSSTPTPRENGETYTNGHHEEMV